MTRALRKWYWQYIFNMEVERGLRLEQVYINERTIIAQMKRKAIMRLRELDRELMEEVA